MGYSFSLIAGEYMHFILRHEEINVTNQVPSIAFLKISGQLSILLLATFRIQFKNFVPLSNQMTTLYFKLYYKLGGGVVVVVFVSCLIFCNGFVLSQKYYSRG